MQAKVKLGVKPLVILLWTVICIAALVWVFPHSIKADVNQGTREIRNWTSHITPLMDVQFHPGSALGNAGCFVDLSYKDAGLALIKAEGDQPLRVKITQGDRSETFYVHTDGTPSVLPLPFGSGDYEIKILEQKEGQVYTARYQTEFSVWSMNDLQAFCNATDYVPFSQDSEYVKEASRLREQASSDEELVRLIVKSVMKHLEYDKSMVSVGDRPDLDLVWSSGRAVCRDYAVITAAMLRSQGIPTKVLYGNVTFPGEEKGYHAWNEYYAGEAGWIRLDVTYMEKGAGLGYNNGFKTLYEASKVF